MVGGVGGDSSGEVIVKKRKTGHWRSWRLAGSTGQYNSRWRQSEEEGKSERVGSLSLIALCSLRCLPMGVVRLLVLLIV